MAAGLRARVGHVEVLGRKIVASRRLVLRSSLWMPALFAVRLRFAHPGHARLLLGHAHYYAAVLNPKPLRDLFDEPDQLVAAVALLPREADEVPRPRDDRSLFRRAGDRDPATASELQHSLVA